MIETVKEFARIEVRGVEWGMPYWVIIAENVPLAGFEYEDRAIECRGKLNAAVSRLRRDELEELELLRLLDDEIRKQPEINRYVEEIFYTLDKIRALRGAGKGEAKND